MVPIAHYKPGALVFNTLCPPENNHMNWSYEFWFLKSVLNLIFFIMYVDTDNLRQGGYTFACVHLICS